MDNQPNGPAGTTPEPTAPAQPVVAPAPQPVAQPQPQLTPPAQPIQQATPVQPVAPQSSGGKAKYIVGGIAAAVLLIFGALFVMALPSIQANAKAVAFMEAVKKNDEKAMKDLSGTGRDGLTDKLNTALKTGSYKRTGSDKKDKSYVVHFDVTGSEAVKDAVVVVENKMVTNLLLNTKGGATAAVSEKTASTTTATGCLTVADLKAATDGSTNIESLDIPQTIGGFYFKADSTEYDPGYLNEFSLKQIGKIYAATKDKTFTYIIRGSVNDANSSAANDKLANDRAAKVKADLVAKGVDASRVVTEAPDYGSLANDPVTYRTVHARVAVPTSCGGQSDTATGR